MTTDLPIPALLRSVTVEPGRPRLTWYGGEERVELSGHVLDNWVTKTANLLVEELEAGPGTLVVLDLPVHWRLPVWALGAWRTGACVVLTDRTSGVAPGSVVVTTRPEQWAEAAGRPQVVAVGLGTLDRAWSGALPPGALDGNAALLSHGDMLTYMPPTPVTASALALGDRAVSFAELRAWASQVWAGRRAGSARGSSRVLLMPTAEDRATVLAGALEVWAADGSLVLCSVESGQDLLADPARLEHLMSTERVDA